MLGHKMVSAVVGTTSASFGRGGEVDEEAEPVRSWIILAAVVLIFVVGFVNILIGCEWVVSHLASQNTWKWRRDESRRRIYVRKIPHVYTLRLKLLEQAIKKKSMMNQYHCNTTYRYPHMISYKYRKGITTDYNIESRKTTKTTGIKGQHVQSHRTPNQ